MKEIQHDNVTRFVGACLDPGTQNTEWLPVTLYDITLLKGLLGLIRGFLWRFWILYFYLFLTEITIDKFRFFPPSLQREGEKCVKVNLP